MLCCSTLGNLSRMDKSPPLNFKTDLFKYGSEKCETPSDLLQNVSTLIFQIIRKTCLWDTDPRLTG